MEDAIISVRNLHKWYSGVHALKGVSLDLKRGEKIALIGGSGAGLLGWSATTVPENRRSSTFCQASIPPTKARSWSKADRLGTPGRATR